MDIKERLAKADLLFLQERKDNAMKRLNTAQATIKRLNIKIKAKREELGL